MARSKGVTISVKAPIAWERMTEKNQQRLRQTVGRDTRAIRSYLGIIERHENTLLTGRNKVRIDSGRLQELTLTALKVKAGKRRRLSVPHDMKSRFPRISQNELVECRQTAVSMYESYLRLRKKRGRKASRPTHTNGSRRIPRWVFSQRFKLIERPSARTRWWVSLRDSMDSVPKGRKIHDRLMIPLKTSPFHLNQLGKGEVKALQIFTDRNRKWWITFAVRMPAPPELDTKLPVAVLGIDLGIEKAACASLVTPEKVRETRFFVQEEKVANLKKYDRLVAQLQHELGTRKDKGVPYDGVAKKLRTLRGKRENVAREYDRVLVRQLLDYISELSEKYTLYVSLGRIKNIRYKARKGNRAGRSFRGMLHSWAFARVSLSLRHGLAQLGWSVDGKGSRFQAIPETWTSILCWKCGYKGVRPRQNLFICPTCGNKCNADMNGAINIAGRLITLTSSLHGVRGQGKWASAIARSKRPKARRRKSDGMSLLSEGDSSSDSGESAAVHTAQTSLLSFSDGTGMSDDDPAVENIVGNLSAAESDASAVVQEKEAGSTGGITSR
jgi:transposase